MPTVKTLRRSWSTATLAAAALALPSATVAQTGLFEIEVETGAVWQSSNQVEIPNDGSATRFDLASLVGAGPWNGSRAYLSWRPSEKDELRLLAAPLSVTEVGTPATPITFEGTTFASGTPLAATYEFNSYRLSYRRRVHSGDRSKAWVGFTAKVRDASIGLAQGATTSRKDDLGFVPLLHLAGELRLAPELALALDADALAGGPGRAVDASFNVSYDIAPRWSLRAGYRTVEGGADVASVYNFAWLHYAVASLALRL